MNLVELIEKESMRENAVQFNVGDTIRVHFRIVEGTKERIQVFEGLVIARKNGGIRETFTVRKISFGVGVERTFPVHSPRIDKVEVIREGSVARAKLYYIRDLSGKAATKVKEKKSALDTNKKVTKSETERLAEIKGNKAKTAAKKPAAKKTTKTPDKKVQASVVKRQEKRAAARVEKQNAPAEAPESKTE